MTDETKPKMLRCCSRCGEEWGVLGRVLQWGKYYPTMTFKKADGTIGEIPADKEIKEALCKQCSKELFDSEIIDTAITAERERLVSEISKFQKDRLDEYERYVENYELKYEFEISRSSYNGAIQDVLTLINPPSNQI